MGEPVHAARAVAVSLDLGHGIPPGTRLGNVASSCGRCGAGTPLQRAGGFAPPRCGARKQPGDRSPLMELLLILIYVSFCYVVFKVFRIRVNQWSLATAALAFSSNIEGVNTTVARPR